MQSRVIVASLIVVLLGPAAVFAQQATVVGAVRDESQALLPGVTVTATALDTGRQYLAVTSERGEYRLTALPPGRFKLEAELSGFSPAVVPELELLVGQSAQIMFTLTIAGVAETVEVTGGAPLVDTIQSHAAGNVDRRQMEALPILGRNWLDLSLQVKGITANTIGITPGVDRTTAFRLNLDGQEITQDRVGSFGQSGISRDAIAEYQIITNMFDVTMGRSVGIQVQAISRSGTNNVNGSAYGYFRDDVLNARDHFVRRVLPFSNQQVGGTIGGPVTRDKMHYFVSYEYERQPDTAVLAPAALAPQRAVMSLLDQQHSVLGRLDAQLSSKDRISFRSNYWKREYDYAATHTSRTAKRGNYSYFVTANWTRLLRSNLVQEAKVGHYAYELHNVPNEPATIEYVFPGFTFGSNWNWPSIGLQKTTSLRYDLTWNKGTHDIKMGSEVQVKRDRGEWKARSRGNLYFNRLPADVARRFPMGSTADQWDFSGLDSSVTRFDIYFARDDDWRSNVPRPTVAGWIGDTWAVRPRLKLNLGARYDVAWKEFDPPGVEETTVMIDSGFTGPYLNDVGYRHGIADWTNIAPRAGFTWAVTEKNDFVIRGGGGLFYSLQGGQLTYDAQLWNGQKILVNSFPNDGQPGFIQDPTRGVTAADVFAGRVPVPPQAIQVFAHKYQNPRMFQAMLGFQKQLTPVLGIDADLMYNKGSREDIIRDPNVFYDPATGLYKNPTKFGRPNPTYGQITQKTSLGYSDYMALATSLTRRYRNNFQLSVNYTLMFYKRDAGVCNQGNGTILLTPFDVSAEFTRGSDFQRHTVNANGIVHLPWAVQLAGTFHYGSGNFSSVTSAVSPLGQGPQRVRADMTVIPRNTFKQDPWQSLNFRLSKEIRLVRDIKLTGIAEVFNVYNYARYNQNTIEGHALFGTDTSAANQPRGGQLAFKISW